MKWESMPSNDYEIKDLHCTLRESTFFLTWYWPKEVEFVYIYIAPADKSFDITAIGEGDLKLYTREEYKAKKGYEERIRSIGRFQVRVFPCMKQDGGELLILQQETEQNQITFTTGKVKIYYHIEYKNKLFQSRKKCLMTITTETPIDKDVLCYVKKSGAFPVSTEDGVMYPFIHDFQVGENTLSELELGKNEHIRIFFRNGKTAAEIYELIPK